MPTDTRNLKRTTRIAAAWAFAGLCLHGGAQPAADVRAELQTLNQKLAGFRCGDKEGRLVTHRAMNLLLSDKIGSYLSQFNDVSFYKNNVTFNAADGTFSLTHNLFAPAGTDSAVRTFFTVGGRADASNAFAAAFANKPFWNRMGVTLKKTWLSTPKTDFTCAHKEEMDAGRAAILALLLAETEQRALAFEASLNRIQPADVPGQDTATAREGLRKKFLADLRDEAIKRFSAAQSALLIKQSAYQKITVNWTSVSVYLPVMRQRFFVAESAAAPIERKHSFPVELALTHTRLLDWGAKGRLFFTVEASVFQNNAAQSNLLAETAVGDYLRLGGTDTLRLAELGRSNLYRGRYQNFFTPAARVQVVYFPPDSHIGLSGQWEQNFGRYKARNFVLGFPVVLIDKETNPAANFHFQIRYADAGNAVRPATPAKDKISVGLTVGVPFSKIIY